MTATIAVPAATASAQDSPPRAAMQRGALPPAAVSAAQFRSFRWIVGQWRGLGTGPLAAVGVFYEEYALVNDSTIHMRTAADSTFTRFTDSTRFEWRAGTLSAIPARGTTRVATRFAGDSIQWSGMGTLYVRMTDDVWRAVFAARAPGGERPHYELRRIPGTMRAQR